MTNRARIFSVSFFIGLLIFFYTIYVSWTSQDHGPYLALILTIISSLLVHSGFHSYFEVESWKMESTLAVGLSLFLTCWICYAHWKGDQASDDTILVLSWIILSLAGALCATIYTVKMSEGIDPPSSSDYLALTTWAQVFLSPWLLDLRTNHTWLLYGLFCFGCSVPAIPGLLFAQIRVGLHWQRMTGYTSFVLIASLVTPLVFTV